MSFWQQAGRVGRRAEREAVVVFVAGDDALDQYHIQHPETLFGQSVEHAVVDPTNAAIQLGHLLCAAAERPLEAHEVALFPSNAPGLLERLTGAGELAGPPWQPTHGAPHADVSLRGTSREPYTLHGPRGVLATIEPPYLQRECFPGAIYLHNGRAYRVQALDAATHVVRLVEATTDVRTTPIVELEVVPREAPLATRALVVGEHELSASVGPLRVHEHVVGYRELKRSQSFSYALAQPLENVLDSVGLWIDVPPALGPDVDSLHAFEHGLVNALPLHLLCDRRDIGSSTALRRVYVYDFAEGGIGLADKAFLLLETIMAGAAALLRDCQCRDGCPSCIHLPGCPDGNNHLDKLGGLALLEGRAADAARAAARLLGARPGRRAGDSAARRRNLRQIADADLRERFSATERPAWLEPGALASLAGVGLVMVCSVQGEWAEVQVLSDASLRHVHTRELAPPTR
jgi:DEAD/DEAH box helicase domain-containing protein